MCCLVFVVLSLRAFEQCIDETLTPVCRSCHLFHTVFGIVWYWQQLRPAVAALCCVCCLVLVQLRIQSLRAAPSPCKHFASTAATVVLGTGMTPGVAANSRFDHPLSSDLRDVESLALLFACTAHVASPDSSQPWSLDQGRAPPDSSQLWSPLGLRSMLRRQLVVNQVQTKTGPNAEKRGRRGVPCR